MMSMDDDVEMAQRKEVRVKAAMPSVKIFFLPWMSASLPKGTREMAAAKI
jgi:hypothetical protein